MGVLIRVPTLCMPIQSACTHIHYYIVVANKWGVHVVPVEALQIRAARVGIQVHDSWKSCMEYGANYLSME